MRLCPQGHPVEQPDARFCGTCGASLAAALETPACGLHPDRPGEPCPRCGTFACQECLGPPGAAVRLCPACRAREAEQPLPWDERAELGTWRAYFKTAFGLMFSPARTLDQTRPTGTVGSSLLFALLSFVLSISTTALFYGVAVTGFTAIVLANVEKRTGTLGPAEMILIWAGVVALFTVLFVLVGLGSLLLNSALDHVVLNVIGAKPRGWEVTLRASALAQAPALCGVIPFCGPNLHFLWAIVLKVFLYRRVHGLTGGQAALGAILVPAIVFVLGSAGYALLLLAAANVGR